MKFVAEVMKFAFVLIVSISLILILGSVAVFICVGIGTLNKKEPEMAQEVTSLAALMKSNARLKKHVEVAKKTTPQQDYNGPPGEVIVKFNRNNIITKDGNTYYILDFKVDGTVAGQEQYNGHRIGILHGLTDSQYRTAEQGLDNLMCDLQLMGIDTKDLTLDQIDAGVKATVGKSVLMRVVKRKDGKGNNFYIGGLAADAGEQDYSTPETDEAPEAAEADEEWSEELAEEAEAGEEEAEFNASDWIGFEVSYKPAKAPKALAFQVVDADDKDNTVTLERDGKKIKNVKFTDLILPEE
jgi:hypothetical protein